MARTAGPVRALCLAVFQSEGPRSIARRIPRCSRLHAVASKQCDRKPRGKVPSLACTDNCTSAFIASIIDVIPTSCRGSARLSLEHRIIAASWVRSSRPGRCSPISARRSGGGYHALTAAGTGTRWCVSPTAGVGLPHIAPWRRKCDLPEWGVMPEIPDGFAIPQRGTDALPRLPSPCPWASPETASVTGPRGRSPANRGAS